MKRAPRIAQTGASNFEVGNPAHVGLQFTYTIFQIGNSQNPGPLIEKREDPTSIRSPSLLVSRSFTYVVNSRATNYEIRSLKFTASSDRSDCRFDKFATAPPYKSVMRLASHSEWRIFGVRSGGSPRFSSGLFGDVVVTCKALTFRCDQCRVVCAMCVCSARADIRCALRDKPRDLTINAHDSVSYAQQCVTYDT